MEDSNDKVYGILSYLGILVLISLAMGKTSFAKFHANQGLVLFIIEVLGAAILGIGLAIPVIRVVFAIVGGLFELICLCLAILGIVSAVNGETKELPVIGAVKLIK